MRPGRLDRKITIQRRTDSVNTSGQPVPTWSDLAYRRSASYAPKSGGERFSNPELIGKQMVEFRVRKSSGIADLSVTDRVLYPAPSGSNVQSPDADVIFDIVDVAEIGRNEGFKILAQRRSERF